VNPPEGDMAAYFASLHRMLGRADRLYLPGHGPAVHDPADYGQFLLAHRTKRENAIVAQLSAQPRDTPELVDLIYTGLAPHLHKAAQRNVTAHLLKLAGEGRAGMSAGGWILI
jgi:glyoxylase-like metal-dependent hydrolase (beta-lactamase superfamily II)